MDLEESDLIISAFPDAQIYKAKELCHQVPVCFKEPLSHHIGSCGTERGGSSGF